MAGLSAQDEIWKVWIEDTKGAYIAHVLGGLDKPDAVTLKINLNAFFASMGLGYCAQYGEMEDL